MSGCVIEVTTLLHLSDGTKMRLSDHCKKHNCVHLQALSSKIAAWI